MIPSQPTVIVQENSYCSLKMTRKTSVGTCSLGVQVNQPWEITSDLQISLISVLTDLLVSGWVKDHNILALLHGQVPCSFCLAQARAAWQLSHCAEVELSALELKELFSLNSTKQNNQNLCLETWRGKMPRALIMLMHIKHSCCEFNTKVWTPHFGRLLITPRRNNGK